MSEIRKRVDKAQSKELNRNIKWLAKKIALRSKLIVCIKRLKLAHSIDPRILQEATVKEERDDLANDLRGLIAQYDKGIKNHSYLRDQQVENIKAEYKKEFGALIGDRELDKLRVYKQ